MSTEKIRTLNDNLRTTLKGGRVMLSAGVAALSDRSRGAALKAVRTYSTFGPDNDPHGEHDFGALDIEGKKLFWKINYYDRKCELGSENPSDPAQTTRVLTICLAEEY